MRTMSLDLKEKIIKEIHELPDSMLEKIQKIIETFKKDNGVPAGKGRFDDVFGTISDEDAEEMLKAVSECRSIY